MADKTYPPLWLCPAASPSLKRYLAALHAMAGASLLFVDDLSARILISLIILLSLHRLWHQYVRLRGAAAIRQACWEADGSWLLQDGMGRWERVQHYRSIWASPRIVLVQFSAGRVARRQLLLPADTLAGEVHRLLRVRLTLQPFFRESEEGM